MGGPILHLDVDDLCALLAAVDPAESVAEELLSRPVRGPVGAVAPPGPTSVSQGREILLWDPVTDTRCALPTCALRACRAAGLTTLAASHLLTPGLVTVSLIGSGAVARIHLMVVARDVPDVSHVAVYTPDPEDGPAVDRTVSEALEKAGIGLSVATRAEDATFGANLVVLVGPERPRHRLGHLSPGAVLVNASGYELSADTADDACGVFVDDLDLLPDEPPATRVEADLRQVFTGRHPGRVRADDVLRVELLSAAVPDTALAARFHRAAMRYGRGVLETLPSLSGPPVRRPPCSSSACS